MGRRSFGTVRRLPSGRYQARYRGPDGTRYSAPDTFVTKADATRWLARVETEISAGRWVDPTTGDVTLAQYATGWLIERTVKGRPLAPRTLDTYRHSLDAHILPTLGQRRLGTLTPALIRTWHADALAAGPTAARQSYALLRAILNTAVTDEAILRNPCRIPGAGQPTSPERPLMTVTDVERITDELPDWMRPLITVSFWGALRLGEVLALRYEDVDLKAGTIRIESQHVETRAGRQRTEPKAASRRIIHLPNQALGVLRVLLAERPGLPSAPLFTRPGGKELRHGHVQWQWRQARRRVGLPGVHLHDLRHASLTLTAQLGATQAELMRRAGHSSARAAAIYQHAAQSRDADLAALLSRVATRSSSSSAD